MVAVIKGRRMGFRRFWRWLWVGLVMGGGADTRLCRLSALSFLVDWMLKNHK